MPRITDRAWAVFLCRAVLWLIFLVAGVFKCFQMTPLRHAREFFVGPYANTFLPSWSLWATGMLVPIIELVSGGLVVVGYKTRPALLSLGGVLVLVTFGHLLKEPFYEFHTHVVPRLALLTVVLVLPREEDTLSLDSLLARRHRNGR